MSEAPLDLDGLNREIAALPTKVSVPCWCDFHMNRDGRCGVCGHAPEMHDTPSSCTGQLTETMTLREYRESVLQALAAKLREPGT